MCILHIYLLSLLGLLTFVHGNLFVYTEDLPNTIVEEFFDVESRFGAELPHDGLRGYLVKGEPENGCSSLKPPDDFTKKWIVLIARHNCSFEMKIRNAQAAGYDCAIVHNVNSSELEMMSARHPDGITIPSVFVGDLAGFILGEEFIYTKGFYVVVKENAPTHPYMPLISRLTVVGVLCVFVILIFVSII